MLIEIEVKFKLPIVWLLLIFRRDEKLLDVILGEQGTTQDAHNLHDRTPKFEVVLDDGNETVGDNGDVDLYSDGILGISPKFLDLEVLLNPLEEQFDLPSVLVKESDVLGWKVEVVRIICECPMKVLCIEYNASDGKGIVLPVPLAGESDCLVSQDVVLSFKQVFSCFGNIVRTELFPYDEECSRLLNGEEPGEVKVASVKHIAGETLVCDPVHRIDIVHVGIGDSVEHRNLRDNIHLSVDLDARLRASEFRPKKERHAEVNGSGVHSIEPAVQFKLFRNASGLGNGHHMEGKLLKDAIVPEVISLRKRTLVNGCLPESEVKRLLSMSCCYICEFSQPSATHKLSEHKDKQLAPMRRNPISGPVAGLRHKAFEIPLWQEAGDLSKNVLSMMHICPKFDLGTKVRISKVRQGSENLLCCA